MKVYRLSSSAFANDLSGTGAALYPGRWNRRGVPVVYTGESKELALLETLVHVPLGIIPKMVMITIHIPNSSIVKLTEADLPGNWTAYPAPALLAECTYPWIENAESIALGVPSCIIPSSYNYILNPKHPQFDLVSIISSEDFIIDARFTNIKRE